MRGELPAKAPVAPPMDALTIADIEADVIAELLAIDDAEREEGDDRRHLQTAIQRVQWPELEAVALREAAGVGGVGKVFHSFRHTFKRPSRASNNSSGIESTHQGRVDAVFKVKLKLD